MKCILLLFLLSPLLFSATPNTPKTSKTENKVSFHNSEQIEKLKEEIRILKNEIKLQENLTINSFDSITTQLSAGAICLALITLGLGIAGLVLGYSISKKAKHADDIEKTVTACRKKAINILKEVHFTEVSIQEKFEEIKTIKNYIDNNITALYEKIKDEETEHILNRLINIPEDIDNLFHSLASRDNLQQNSFLKLKKALGNLNEKCSSTVIYHCAPKYISLLCQHFYRQAILDKFLNCEILKEYNYIIHCSFNRELVSLITVLYDLSKRKELYNYREHLSELFKALCVTPSFNVKSIYSLVYNLAETKEFKFELMEILFNNTGVTNLKNVFAKDLVEEFKNTELSFEQNNTLVKAQDILTKIEEAKTKAELAKKEAKEKNLQQT